jgi:hypothetical protein
MKNKGLIFGGIAAVAVIIGGTMWYKKAKKDGKLPTWLSADGEWNSATGECYKNNKGGFDCIAKDGFVRSGSTLQEAKDLAGKVGVAVPAKSYRDYRKTASSARMA